MIQESMQEINRKVQNDVFLPEPYMQFSHRFTAIQILLLAAALMLPCSVMAKAPGGTDGPIQIEADRMVSREQDNSVVFMGNVDARQGDLLIRSDEMTVFYEQQEDTGAPAGSGSAKVEKLICTGNVQISQGNWLGTGRKMDYYAGDRKVILSGDAKAWQGQNMVTGRTITYYLDEGRSVVESPDTGKQGEKGTGEGESGRVKAVIQPEGKTL